MTDPWEEPAPSESDQAGKPLVAQDAAGEGEDPADLSLAAHIRRAIIAQGKADPDAVFADAEHVDLDDDAIWAHEMRDDPGPADVPPLDESQEALEIDEMNRPEWA